MEICPYHYVCLELVCVFFNEGTKNEKDVKSTKLLQNVTQTDELFEKLKILKKQGKRTSTKEKK